MIGDELGERMVSIGFRCTGKLTSAALYKVVGLIRTAAHETIGSNKVSFKKLNKGDAQLAGVELSKSEIEGFDKYAKRYKFDYSLVREINDHEKYNFMFKSKDISKLDASARDFLKDNTKEHGNLKEKFEQAREEAYRVNKAQSKEKEKTHAKAPRHKEVEL